MIRPILFILGVMFSAKLLVELGSELSGKSTSREWTRMENEINNYNRRLVEEDYKWNALARPTDSVTGYDEKCTEEVETSVVALPPE